MMRRAMPGALPQASVNLQKIDRMSITHNGSRALLRLSRVIENDTRIEIFLCVSDLAFFSLKIPR